MAKTKKKKPIADKIRTKRSDQEKKAKENPFELKINRQKHEILGRKLSKYDKGNPGLSRSKATKKRMHTLLKEHELQHKSNRFIDRRFGERDKVMTAEDKMMKRYALERSKNTSKSKFNLNEEEELTHFGQSLAEIEKFDEPLISDEDEDDDDKRASAKLVAEEHFGGFLTKKVDSGNEKKSWKERMEELIAQSKQAKHEKQVEKEKNEQLTEEVDEQWKQLHGIVSFFKGKGDKEDEKPKPDDYDITVRELLFEIKGKATDRLKTEEELAKEEKERLDRLEADRIRRMKGIPESNTKDQPKHVSADDLDDGFDFTAPDFDYVSYKDGKLLTEVAEDKTKTSSDDSGSENDDEGDDNDDGDEEDDDGDEEDDDDLGKPDEETGGEEEDSDSEEDNFSDLDSDDDDEEEEEEKADIRKSKAKAIAKTKTPEEEDKAQSTPMTEEAKQQMIEMAKKELPYTFKAPESYDELLDMLEGHGLEQQLTIIDRIRKCHHPSLAEGNKDKLELLFGHLVQFYGDLCIQEPPQLDFVDRLVKHLYELTQLSPLAAARTLLAQLIDRQAEFREICEKKKGRGLYPGLDTLLVFKLVALLFPTSDFYHHVTTPALMFMCQILSQCPVTSGRDVVAGIFLCNMCLEYVSMSKRFLPEVINFLHGLVFLAADKEPKKIEPVIPPFKPVGKAVNLLHVKSKVKSLKEDKWSITQMMSPEAEADLYDSDQFRVTAVQHCVCLLEEFARTYADYHSYTEIFSPVLYMCDKLPVKKYPESLQSRLASFVTGCRESCSRPRPPLAMEKKKPKPLKMFEPAFEEEFTGRKRGRPGKKELNEKQKLMYKHRQAMKGAKRELRKDTRFLARHRLQEQLEKDSERKRKVKQIYGGLAMQEGEYKKMKRGIAPD